MSAGQGPDRNGDAQNLDAHSRGAHDLDAERLAAAIEQGTTPGSVSGELARDLDLVAMLRTRGAAYDPRPEDRARAKQKLMAALMVADVPAPADLTAPLSPTGADDATAVMRRVTDD
ncbi:MAG: hypothetical protein H7Y15_13885, partial [Pseudonocardia sp.]|nr:hypothetical protein [Pseudonocardia sp.]